MTKDDDEEEYEEDDDDDNENDDETLDRSRRDPRVYKDQGRIRSSVLKPRGKFSDLSEKLCERLLRGAIALLGKPAGRDHLAEGNSAIIRWHPLMPVRPESCRSQ